MAKIKDMIDGLRVLRVYAKAKGEGDEVSLDHDVLYAGPSLTQGAITGDDLKRLEEAGWHYSQRYECWGRFL
jgi:hypothetical protein